YKWDIAYVPVHGIWTVCISSPAERTSHWQKYCPILFLDGIGFSFPDSLVGSPKQYLRKHKGKNLPFVVKWHQRNSSERKSPSLPVPRFPINSANLSDWSGPEYNRP